MRVARGGRSLGVDSAFFGGKLQGVPQKALITH